MEKLHKEPDAHRQDYNAFINELKQFHQNKGTVFRHLPRINGREIDLFTLYNQVTALGGWQKVNDQHKWDIIVDALKLPKACANSSLALRQLYIRYLGHYEKIHFMGEEPDHDRSQSSESHPRKQHTSLLSQVPMYYNQLQHEVSENARVANGLNQQFIKATDYDKLCMSLLSGLPNEQELALNVCTILSNEGNHMLHLEEAPKLVNLLIAQTGIWPLGDTTLKDLYLGSWKNTKGRNMYKFWRNTLDLSNQQFREIFNCEIGTPDPDEKLLCLESNLGAYNVEGQRVLRVALILHNLSFEKNNIPVLISNANFLRFLLLCIHSAMSNLKQTAYDTLGNLANEIKLSIEKDICSRIMFQTVMEGIQSSDRYMVIRSMDILSQLCACEFNEDIIPSRLDVEVYQKMVSFLTVRDIMLLFYTLEALYALSDLGRYACEKIVRVHRSIGALVSLLTLEPNQYGASAQIKMKIVETLVPSDAEPSESEKTVNSVSETPTTAAIIGTKETENDSEAFVCNWLKLNCDAVPGNTISRNDLYADYVSFCSKSGRRGVVNANVFAGCVKSTFPQCGVKKVESANGTITFHHDGLKRKKVIAIQTGTTVNKVITNAAAANKNSNSSNKGLPCIAPKPGQKTNHSPILKAQLSAPPRTSTPSNQPKRPLTPAAHNQKSMSPSPPPSPCYPSPSTTPTPLPPTPVGPGSSTLIKSLLANKVQQRHLQRQQLIQQNVGKVVIYAPEKVTQMNRSVINPQQTVLTTIRPVTLNQTCITTNSPRTPLQARIITNKSCMVAATPSPRIIKTNPPVIAPKPPKTPKSHIMTNAATIATARLNGVQRDVQLEVCSQAEEAKNLMDAPVCQETHIKRIQNSLSPEKTFIADSNDSVLTSDGESIQSLKDSSFSSDGERNLPFAHVLENSGIKPLSQNELPLFAGNQLIFRSISTGCDTVLGLKDQNGTNLTLVNSGSLPCQASLMQTIIQPKTSIPCNQVRSSLMELDPKVDDLSKQKFDKEKICKRAPLLNGLLDKGKVPPSKDLQPSSILQNGGKLTSNQYEVISEDNKTSATQIQATIAPAVIPPSPFPSNCESLMQICTGQTTLSGTIEVEPDQKGVVRLHIESPENSNQGSDLSSISDIARTLECASKAISRTNAECNSQQLPFTDSTTATVTVITTNTPTLARAGQQIIVVTPALNQPQLHIQSPNIKFRILHSVPKVEDSVDLIGFPRVSFNQLSQMRQPSDTPSISTATPSKRPSNDSSVSPCVSEVKKPRLDTKTPLLEATLRLPTSTSNTVSLVAGEIKAFQDSHQVLLSKQTQLDNVSQSPKLSAAKAVAVPVQNVEFPSEREIKTFSGLSPAGEPTSNACSSHAPPKSVSAVKLEYLCEWKDCGKRFSNPGAVFFHASKMHAPLCNDDMICLWEGCDSMKRRRFSLLTHLQDWHCNERALHIQALRRKQLTQQGKTSIAPPQPPPPHPGYAPDAALLAIRRHALQYLNPKELSEEKESALTKSIRLTSALILRNLVTHSPLARSYLRRYEPELAYLAMSPVESARTIAQCLSELSRPHE